METKIKFPRPDRDDCGSVEIAFTGVKFPIEWGKDYYVATMGREYIDKTCDGCEGSQKIKLSDGRYYDCPKCHGHGKTRDITALKQKVAKYHLSSVFVQEDSATLIFCANNTLPKDGCTLNVISADFATMKIVDDKVLGGISHRYIYDTLEEAQAEIDRGRTDE